MEYILPSQVLPLAVNKRWTYSYGVFLFNRDIQIDVVDKKGSHFLVKVSSNNIKGSAILQSDVDLSVIAVSKDEIDTLNDESQFKMIPKIDILKSPIEEGTSWDNMLGNFKIISTDYKLDYGKKTYPGCVYIKIKDTSFADNEVFIKPGIGIIFASIFIDGLGKIYLSLKNYK